MLNFRIGHAVPGHAVPFGPQLFRPNIEHNQQKTHIYPHVAEQRCTGFLWRNGLVSTSSYLGNLRFWHCSDIHQREFFCSGSESAKSPITPLFLSIKTCRLLSFTHKYELVGFSRAPADFSLGTNFFKRLRRLLFQLVQLNTRILFTCLDPLESRVG